MLPDSTANQKPPEQNGAGHVYRGKAAQDYDARRFTSRSGVAIHQMEMEAFRLTLDSVVQGSRVLEVGCGTGRFLLVAAEAGMSCTGVDPSPDMLVETGDKLRSRGFSPELFVAGGQKLPINDGEFDLVYSIRVLNQMGSRSNALAAVGEMLRVCRPGGQVLIEFVNAVRRPFSRNPKGVYLWPAEVVESAKACGARLSGLHGTFIFGMTAIHRTPSILQPALLLLDAVLSRIAPRLCSRCYARFEKGTGNSR